MEIYNSVVDARAFTTRPLTTDSSFPFPISMLVRLSHARLLYTLLYSHSNSIASAMLLALDTAVSPFRDFQSCELPRLTQELVFENTCKQ